MSADKFQPAQLEAGPHARREAAQAEQRKRAVVEEDKDKAAVLWLLSDDRGFHLAAKLLGNNDFLRSSFRLNSMEQAQAEGKKSGAYWLLALVRDHAPEHLARLLKEPKRDP